MIVTWGGLILFPASFGATHLNFTTFTSCHSYHRTPSQQDFIRLLFFGLSGTIPRLKRFATSPITFKPAFFFIYQMNFCFVRPPMYRVACKGLIGIAPLSFRQSAYPRCWSSRSGHLSGRSECIHMSLVSSIRACVHKCPLCVGVRTRSGVVVFFFLLNNVCWQIVPQIWPLSVSLSFCWLCVLKSLLNFLHLPSDLNLPTFPLSPPSLLSWWGTHEAVACFWGA